MAKEFPHKRLPLKVIFWARASEIGSTFYGGPAVGGGVGGLFLVVLIIWLLMGKGCSRLPRSPDIPVAQNRQVYANSSTRLFHRFVVS